MPLAPGARLGPYEILAPIGAGGMGEVYKARDTRLDRAVAVKVLPSHVAGLPELRQRLEREARAVSNLSHPNICALFDVGHQDGVDFLVMEYVEGETLAARLERGALPPRDLLRHAIEIAEALDKAHRQGVLHRDLKPGNVMLTKSGAKLLDFGLAKSVAPPAASNATASPTLTTPLTAQGAIIGTFQYMAPEQLEGGEADVRSDIFAFGAVLYEMATGRRAFEGKTQASLAASILKVEPRPVSALAPATPPALERIIRVCLAKDPGDRWQTAHDLAAELRWIAEAPSGERAAAPPVAGRRGRERIAWTLGAVLAATTLALSVALWWSARPAERAVFSSILPPEKSAYRFTGFGAGPVEVSPDGMRLAFVAAGEDGDTRLWVRPLDAPEARVLTGTEGASYPFWSPDGRFIGFFAEGKLKKVEAAGGPPLTLCDAPDARGGSWSREGVILFEPHWRAPLHRVSASGGAPEPVTAIDAARKETTHRWPWFLPDGRRFLYLAGTHIGGTSSEVNAIFVGSLDSKETKLLVNARSNAAYAHGRILFVRDRTLMAQPFDPGRLEMTGDAVPLAEHVAYDPGFFRAIFSVGTGVLAYQEGSGAADVSQLTWFDREGRQLETVGTPGQWWIPRTSRDGRRLAVGSGDPGDLWLFDLSRGAASRFTFDPADDSSPVWSPDDGAIAFCSFRSGFGDLFRKVSSGTGNDEQLLSSDTLKFPTDWSRDGRLLVFNGIGAQTRTDVWIYSIEERKATPFLASEFDEGDANLSPDGRWIAYTSSEAGREDIYVQSFPGPGGKWQVSTAGGSMSKWSPDGREIFYIAPDRKLMAVEIKAGAGFETAAPRALFETRIKGSPDRQYDVSPDGRRFLINTMLKDEAQVPLTLVQGWTGSMAR